MATDSPVGYPPLVGAFAGIDTLGRNCRISPSVSVFREVNPHAASGIHLGDDVMLFEHVRLLLGAEDARLELGNRVTINVGGYISGEGGLLIEDDVMVGPHVRLLSAGHEIHGHDRIVARNPITYGSIRVGRGAWIAGGVTVLEGLTIGEGAVIGAGSVVADDVPAFAVAVGNPARVVHYRQGHDPIGWWWRRRLARRNGGR